MLIFLMAITVSFYFVLTTHWQNAVPFLFSFYIVKIATMSDMYFIQLNVESNIRKLRSTNKNSTKAFSGQTWEIIR